MAETHVPYPNDLRLSIWIYGSAAKATVGGVGTCYGKWLPAQRDGLTKFLSFVVPSIYDANVCELMALADAVLVALDEIKENVATLKVNNWATQVMIWSDSHTALKYLKHPEGFPRFEPGRPAEIRALILRVICEVNSSIPIKGPIQFHWIPGLCTKMNQAADSMPKNSIVKSGRAPLSLAMKMLFPRPSNGPRPVSYTALPASSHPKVTELSGGRVKEEEQVRPGRKMSHTTEMTDPGNGNTLKRRASAAVDVDNGRPPKAMRCSTGVLGGDTNSKSSVGVPRAPSNPSNPSNPIDARLAFPQPPTTCADPHASRSRLGQQYEVVFNAIDEVIFHSGERSSVDTIWQRSKTLDGSQRDRIQEGIVKQILANQKPFDPAIFFLRMSNNTASAKMEACFPNTLSIIDDAVRKLPDPMRSEMRVTVEQQHDQNRLWAAHLAIMRGVKPQSRDT